MRSDVTISSGGEQLAAWLYRPEDASGDVPCVVMAHGFAAVKDQRLGAYAERFAAAGLACVVFDYRHFGGSSGQPRQLLSIKKQLEDYRAVLAYARGLDGVDAGRLALWGSSFSGGHVTGLAVSEPDITCVVAQAPFGDGLANLPPLGVGPIAKATASGLRDVAQAARSKAPHYIPAGGEPGSDALLQQPGALTGYEAIVDADGTWDNRVAARIALQIGTYRPATKAAKITVPILFCVCDDDDVTPPGPILKAAVAAPRGELKRYPLGHWGIYLGEPWETAVADQTEFLVRHLKPARPASSAREPASATA